MRMNRGRLMRREVKKGMSEFECANGHLMLPSKSMGGRCHICGAPCVRMDGMTDAEMRARDEEFDRERECELEEKAEEEYFRELEEGGEESEKAEEDFSGEDSKGMASEG